MRECDTFGCILASPFFSFLGYSVRKCGPDVRRREKSTRITPGSERKEISRRDEREGAEKEEEEEEEDLTNTREETRDKLILLYRISAGTGESGATDLRFPGANPRAW